MRAPTIRPALRTLAGRVTTSAVAAIALTVTLTSGLEAQSFWLEHRPGETMSVEVNWPNYPSRGYYHLVSPWPTTSGVILGFRHPLAERITLTTDLPFAHASGRNGGEGFIHGTILGNPYLGGELALWRDLAIFRLGIRLPVQRASHYHSHQYDNVAATVGMVSEFVDRTEAFVERLTSEMAEILLATNVGPAVRVRALLGASLLQYPNEEHLTRDQDRSQLHLRLGAQALVRHGPGSLGAGLLARDRVVGSDALPASSRQSYELGVNGAWRWRDWTATLGLRVPFLLGERPDPGFWRVITLAVEREL